MSAVLLSPHVVSPTPSTSLAPEARGQEVLRGLAPEACLEAAMALGERLVARDSRARGDATGPALFLAYLGALTGRGDFVRGARAELEPLLRAWRDPGTEGGTRVGGFVGRGTAVYLFGHLAALWREPFFLDEVLDGLPALEHLIDQDVRLDVRSGATGCAVALLGVYRQTGEARVLAAARRCAERLLTRSRALPDGGRCWDGVEGSVAEIAWALLEMATATGDTRYADAARQGLRHERSRPAPARDDGQAPHADDDLPEQVGPGSAVSWRHGAPGLAPGRAVSWRHGTPGIALGRALCLRHLGQDQEEEADRLRAELRADLEATLREGFCDDFSLGRGNVGTLEVLNVAGAVLGDESWTRAARAEGARVLREGLSRGWRSGPPDSGDASDLLRGPAGIGLGLLRLAAPGDVPSVLCLEGAYG